MSRRRRQWLSFYQYAAGVCDTGTGLLLIFVPAFTFHLMGLSVLPQPVAFVRYIGVFVMSVGITYLWTVTRWPLNEYSAIVWLTQWRITAVIRMFVAVFIVWQLAIHGLEFGWVAVALTDGILAVVQIVGLQQEWIEHAV